MKKIAIVAALSSLVLAGCANDGTYYRADTYAAGAVNQAQQVRTVEILAIGAAKVAVSNEDNRQEAQIYSGILGALAGVAIGHNSDSARIGGGIAGAALGSMAGSAIGGSRTNYVDGVQITFRYNNKIYNSAQVGRPCEFKTGLAVMISSTPTETRIQPNNPNGCPAQ